MNKRVNNIYFWLGLVGIVFTAAGVDFNSLTDWNLLLKSVIGILNNPVAVMSVALAVLGVFVNPTTPGIKDVDIKVIKEIKPKGDVTDFRG